MAEFSCYVLLLVIAMYCSYRYGFIKALQEYNDYLIEINRREKDPSK